MTPKTKIKVLIIDDNNDTALTLTQRFEIMGHEAEYICVASVALDKVKKMQEDEFDYILLDLYLNGISGIDICNALIAREIQGKVVMISGCDHNSEIFKKALELRVPIVMKKFDAKELVKQMELGTVKDWSYKLLEERGVLKYAGQET